MKSSTKFILSLLLVLITTAFVQHSLVDFESAINTETTQDQNLDYDQDGHTESTHSPGLLKVPVVFTLPNLIVSIPHLDAPSYEQPCLFDFSNLMLADYVLSLLRPPSNLVS